MERQKRKIVQIVSRYSRWNQMEKKEDHWKYGCKIKWTMCSDFNAFKKIFNYKFTTAIEEYAQIRKNLLVIRDLDFDSFALDFCSSFMIENGGQINKRIICRTSGSVYKL